MAKLTLDFIPPTEPNIVKLHIYEAASKDASFDEIEFTDDIGTFPNYITRYSIQNANNVTDWFAISWEYVDGIITELSEPIQGGTITLVQMLIDRVMLRDASLNENIVAQEAEGAISEYYNVLDPLMVDSTVSPRILSGLTFMVLARVYIARMVTATQANKWSAGSVSMDTSTASTQTWSNIDKLIQMANKELERNYSVMLLLKEVKVAGELRQIVSYDVSRSMIEIQ